MTITFASHYERREEAKKGIDIEQRQTCKYMQQPARYISSHKTQENYWQGHEWLP